MVNFASTVRVVARFTRTLGDDMMNVLHFRSTAGAPTSTSMDALLAAIRDSWWDTAASTNDIRALTSNEVTLADLTAVSMDVSNVGFFRQLVVAALGSDAGANLPPQMAAVVSHRSAIASRASRGRTYHPGFTVTSAPTSTSSYPVLQAAALTQLQGAWNTMDTAVFAAAGAWKHCIASEATETTYDVINRVYNAKLFTQRRRN